MEKPEATTTTVKLPLLPFGPGGVTLPSVLPLLATLILRTRRGFGKGGNGGVSRGERNEAALATNENRDSFLKTRRARCLVAFAARNTPPLRAFA